MVAQNIAKPDVLDRDGLDIFICFLHSIWKAKSGDEELLGYFKTLDLNLNLHPMALFGLLMSRYPLEPDKALILKRVLELGSE